MKNPSLQISAYANNLSLDQKHIHRFTNEVKFIESLSEIYPDNRQRWEELIDKSIEIFKQELEKEYNAETAVEKAEKALEEISPYAKEFTIHYIGHAHIDMNWMWPWNETVDICYKTFSTADKLMEEYPDFKLSQSQASVYKAMEDYDPHTFELIKERVKKGQWEITANTWVEGDKNLASGESLVRQILYTKKYFKEKFHIPYDKIKIDWEPDTFGHAWTYPQILKKAGIRRYYFCRAGKGVRLFRWQAPDGSEVLAWNDEILWYNFAIKPEEALQAIEHYKETEMKDYMIVYGVGDHGGGPTREHLNAKKEIEKWPLFPKVKFSTTEEYFSIAENYIDKLPVINEELNFTFRGCYTSQSNIKKANRFSENLLAQAEAYGIMGRQLTAQEYPSKQLHKAWINTLFNQFHDILPGSGVHETYEYSQGLFQDIKAETNIVKNRCFKAITENIGCRVKGGVAVTVFNTQGFAVTDKVTVDIYEKFNKSAKFQLKDSQGNLIPIQYRACNNFFDYHSLTFTAKNVPGLGYKTYYLEEVPFEKNQPGAFISFNGNNKKIIENEFFKVTIAGASGAIVSIVDKRNEREFVKEGEALGLLQVLQEAPNNMSAWSIDQIVSTCSLEEGAILEIVERGPAVVTVRSKRKYRASELILNISLSEGVPRIDFKLDMNWMETGDNERGIPSLKAAFPLKAENAAVTYEIPFGALCREEESPVYSLSKSRHNLSTLAVKGEDVPSQKWVDISGLCESGETAGLCIVNNSKYGFDSKGSTVRMSLVRSSYSPDPLPEVGRQIVEFGIYPHAGQCSKGDFARWGLEFNQRLNAYYFDPQEGSLPEEVEMMDIPEKNIILSSVKKGEEEDSVVLRLYEIEGKKTEAQIKINLPVLKAAETDLLEQDIDEIKAMEEGILKISFSPYEIKTVKLITLSQSKDV